MQKQMFRVPRPTQKTIEAEFLKQVVADINDWIADDDYKFSGEDEKKLINVLSRERVWDGYKMCRDLERAFLIEPDAALVDLLDNANVMSFSLLASAVKEWVVANNIVPARKVGDSLSLKFDGLTSPIIVGIDKLHGCYNVAESMDAKRQKSIPFEEVDEIGECCV